MPIGDPFLYLESDGRRGVLTNALEDARIRRAAPELERQLVDEFGRDELIEAGYSSAEIELKVCVRAVRAFGIREAVVPPDFPLALADRLRASGVELTADNALFAGRRRQKSVTEMTGIRRAAEVAVLAFREAARMLREAEVSGDELRLGGEILTAEAVRSRIREVCGRAGAPVPSDIIVKPMGPDPQIGHEPGSGPLAAHIPITVDLWPMDEQSGCYADMTRTFVRGEIGDRIAELYAHVLAAHERSCAAIRPGVTGVEVYGVACDVFEAARYPTGRTKRPGETLREGFYHALGHGVGLEVHEAPYLGRSGREPLLAGDVVAVEPGLVSGSVGGARVEDLLFVTDWGSENLTGAFPYVLTP